MKNILTGIAALIVGAFTLIMATVMGLFISVAALLTTPFIKRKVAYAHAETRFNRANMHAAPHGSNTIDGEYEDVSHR
ncbi:hypothetical protein [Photobacterium sanguinicancri]|uniref:Hydroxylamine reductase n=1 Tax=Photobacterium sanguinicancri TaxID=875932 RepID=A0AAW7Y2T2_9GAMM|nr:hypothetical protein [Photobacterium sanguinicancri]KXI23646.1 hypothetical protein AS132_06630 [Photobacterium sanguinicancri]MDO6542051.1 hypothetical protein [Photobacterium sanguinicancri]OZS45022.1 hypothetical protein ASV53_05195 [Photobacterium sanguinicancri]OZS45510.1 hypothetical protein ASV53_02660 [Photobacterium sanguinicancri]